MRDVRTQELRDWGGVESPGSGQATLNGVPTDRERINRDHIIPALEGVGRVPPVYPATDMSGWSREL